MNIEKYIDAVFGYCIKRLNNIEDAKDLSQEILFEVIKSLRKTPVRDMDAWVWKIAHNRYARFAGKKKVNYISFDDSGIIETLTDEIAENTDDDELKAVFSAVHSLAYSHRSILVDYYISELTYQQMADKYSLPVGTIKTRLFYGKQKLKERWQFKMDNIKFYKKINWFLFGNGDIDLSYIERQITRAIVSACYEKALNIEEISLVTGLPCMYIEDEISKLIYGEILSEAKGGYISNIIIHSEETTRNIESLLLKHSLNLTAATEKTLNDNDTRIKEIGFYGCDKSNDSLWWSLIPILLREACEEARRQNGHVAKPVFPPRRDGGRGWIFVNVSPDEKHKYISGGNRYLQDKSRFLYYWSGKYYNDDLFSFLHKLEDHHRLAADFSACGFDDLMTGECIKYGLAQKENSIIKWSIPIFTSEQYQKLEKLITELALPLAGMILLAVDKIYAMMKAEIPKHLHDQIRGVFGAELNSVIAMVCDKLEEQGKLVSTTNEYFTKQIIMTLK